MSQIRIIVGLVAVVALLFGGWTIRGWYEGNLDLLRERVTRAAIDEALESHSDVARVVEEKLSGLKANQTVIDRGVTREVIKPVYRNVCLPGAGVGLLNAAALNDTSQLPAEPDGDVPEDAADPQ
ncbi:hypothetical protein A3724_16620 [Alcanivorax sp. HI0033]|jgi:hypothetical protein|uniref:hypothetical protein n=1 Tax=unclassified Alcanivorax TaxID=2638842 RepID=UPI0007B9A0EB|nr:MULTISPECIES: hypothetical protein [unclassified Alcanivorax]KZX78113.1 hypothetical protein A3717_11590 [Alcanivorax sp. HI0013]KZX81827.1 hypothetical protein A3716_17120 [Alcanivorax sp. HI0011]KZY14092.1 hypothetical protein A3725_01475 [Alcanivorax sp. HI0035]KZX61291.1 hypothetical protein A3713_09990 [Alcanivorax sp. HI0003]KZX65733.1 hypothetical protein A3714_14990 [Alcanivorax sp. HI0007]